MNQHVHVTSDFSNSCEANTYKNWQQLSESFISLASFEFMQTHPGKRMIEQALIRNSLISKTYAEFFKEAQRSEQTDIFFWTGSAAFGSYAVGKELIQAFKKLADLNKYPTNSRFIQYVLDQNDFKGIGQNLFYLHDFSLALSQANWAIYKDIFWQFLVAKNCGIKTVKKLISELKNKYAYSTVVSTHYKRLIMAWSLIQRGIKYKSHEYIVKGNLKILWDEQYFVLQPILYDPIAAKIVSELKIFNSLATAGVDEENIMTFNEFSEKNNLEGNLANFQNRMQWMNYMVKKHIAFFQVVGQDNQLDRVFSKLIYNTDLVISQYL